MESTESLDSATTHALMALNINTLFLCDAAGRLRHVNDVDDPPVPRFFMGRTLHGNFWRFRHDLPAEVVEALDRLCRAEPVVAALDDLAQPPRNQAAIHAVLQDHAPIEREYRGPAYWITQDSPVPPHVVLISQQNAHLLRDGFDWMIALLHSPDAARIGPVAAAVEQDRAVSLCFCSRLPIRATEAGVETLPPFRGRGHATAAVAGWAAEVRRRGYMPFYSTAWDNFASQAIARKLNMTQYGEDWTLH